MTSSVAQENPVDRPDQLAGKPGTEEAYRYPTEATDPYNTRFLQFFEESDLSAHDWDDKLGILMEEEQWDTWEERFIAQYRVGDLHRFRGGNQPIGL